MAQIHMPGAGTYPDPDLAVRHPIGGMVTGRREVVARALGMGMGMGGGEDRCSTLVQGSGCPSADEAGACSRNL